MKYILALDQGTTSCRTILFDENLCEIAKSQKEIKQIFPQPGWVEHHAEEIWETQLFTINDVIQKSNIDIKNIAAIGITNQRETVVFWNKTTGKPIYHAIVWQDRRTAEVCEKLKRKSLEKYIQENTGLIIDAYFSGTKMQWIIENIPEAKKLIEEKNLACGTIDTWLIWKLTQGRTHATDYSNASRTLIYNIRNLNWDEKLLQELNIPFHILPEVKNSVDDFGKAEINGVEIPIYGVAGDQQAALFGQKCFAKGDVKNTYGTGCFMLMNIGDMFIASQSKLITTIAWGIDHKITYALEGSVFIAGAAIQWLRDQLQIISHSDDSEKMAASIKDNGGVYFVPAFVGLGAPYWDMHAKGSITGLSRGTKKEHIVRAALEAIAYQTKDLLDCMQSDSKIKLEILKVDGGAAKNNWLMQFQSDILQTKIQRPEYLESTALGVAMLAGIGAGLFGKEELLKEENISSFYSPKIESDQAEELYAKWTNAIKKSLED